MLEDHPGAGYDSLRGREGGREGGRGGREGEEGGKKGGIGGREERVREREQRMNKSACKGERGGRGRREIECLVDSSNAKAALDTL